MTKERERQRRIFPRKLSAPRSCQEPKSETWRNEQGILSLCYQ